MVHQYGSDEDWNGYTKLTGDSGWPGTMSRTMWRRYSISTLFVNPVYIKLNAWISSTIKSYLQTTGMIQLANLFRLCMVSAGRSPSFFQGSTWQSTHASWRQLGSYPDFPTMRKDTSGGDHSLLGIGFVQSSIGGEVRNSSSTSYLASANSRPNLTVLIRQWRSFGKGPPQVFP